MFCSRISFLLGFAAALLLLSPQASAQRRNPRRAQQSEDDSPRIHATLADLDTLTEQLQSTDDDVVRGAIERLTVIDHARVVPPLATLLRSGPTDHITDRALDALRAIQERDAIEVLTEFTTHRRVATRRRAFQALASIEDRRIPALVARGLRDSDRTVRGAAAIALGDLGATDMLDTLFHAFDRNVIEAAIAIGKLGDDAAVARFDAHLGNDPLGVMLSGYDEFLRRDDISMETKQAIVERLGEVSGVMVRQFMQGYLRWFPNRIRNRELRALKELVEETIERIPPDGGGTTIRTESGGQ